MVALVKVLFVLSRLLINIIYVILAVLFFAQKYGMVLNWYFLTILWAY